MAKPSILVLLAARNGSAWLRDQIDSILAQRDVTVSILGRDDGSSDGTFEIVNRLYAGESRLKFSAAGRGSGSAGASFRQLFLDAQIDGFDFVALADQDDIWYPEKLVTAVRKLSEESVAGYSASVAAFWPNGRSKLLTQSPVQSRADFLFEGAGQGCTFVISAPLFRRVQTFCKTHPAAVSALHYHDWLIYLLARSWGLTWHFDADACMHYRQHEQNEIGARGGMSSTRRRLSLIKNGWYYQQIKAAFNIYILAGGADPVCVRRIGPTLLSSKSIFRNFALFFLTMLHGRRRIIDRLVLAAAALGGLV